MSPVASAFVVDEQRFLVDIAKEKPAGDPLIYDPLYARIREARRSDDPSLPQGHWQRELKKSDWPLVEELCTEALLHRSKDLQVAAWLLEAWFNLHGVAGLTEGLRVLRAICDRFWATAHPRDPEDDEVRAGPFVWLNERFSAELAARLRISEPQAADALPYTWADWLDALRREAAPRPEEGKKVQVAPPDPARPTRPKITASGSMTPRAFYDALAGDLERAGRALMALQQSLQKHAGAAAPTLGRLADTLRGVREWTATVLADKPSDAPRAEPGANDLLLESPMEAAHPAADATARRRGIASREEAYRQLREASDYLMRTEPHSPTPFLVNRAVAWGGMSLGDLLVEFVRDGYDLKTLRVFLGLNEAAGTR